MKNFFLVLITAAVAIFGYRYYETEIEGKARIVEESALIQTQMENVAKLVVTEGHFSEIYNYEDSRDLFGSWLPYKVKKTALVVVNADVTISYDLDQIDMVIDEQTRTVSISSIPEPEIKLSPDFKYIEIKDNYFNTFEVDDYNAIDETVKASLMKKVRDSEMISNAENRLVSELANFLLLTRSMGWTLVYGQKPIRSADELSSQILGDGPRAVPVEGQD